MKRRLGATLLALVVASACSVLQIPEPIGLEVDTVAVKPGQAFTGTVLRPEGAITVELTSLETREKSACGYSPDTDEFSCPTSAEGVYTIDMTDAAQPGEGTKRVKVAVTDIDDYAPKLTVPRESAEGSDVTIKLSGWGAGREVAIGIFNNDTGEEYAREVLTADESGAADFTLPDAEKANYIVSVNDDFWVVGASTETAYFVVTEQA